MVRRSREKRLEKISSRSTRSFTRQTSLRATTFGCTVASRVELEKSKRSGLADIRDSLTFFSLCENQEAAPPSYNIAFSSSFSICQLFLLGILLFHFNKVHETFRYTLLFILFWPFFTNFVFLLANTAAFEGKWYENNSFCHFMSYVFTVPSQIIFYLSFQFFLYQKLYYTFEVA